MPAAAIARRGKYHHSQISTDLGTTASIADSMRLSVLTRFRKTWAKSVKKAESVHMGESFKPLHEFDRQSASVDRAQEVAEKWTGSFDGFRFEELQPSGLECERMCAQVWDLKRDMMQSSGAFVESLQRPPVRNHKLYWRAAHSLCEYAKRGPMRHESAIVLFQFENSHQSLGVLFAGQDDSDMMEARASVHGASTPKALARRRQAQSTSP
jgi:hypothetical protein